MFNASPLLFRQVSGGRATQLPDDDEDDDVKESFDYIVPYRRDGVNFIPLYVTLIPPQRRDDLDPPSPGVSYLNAGEDYTPLCNRLDFYVIVSRVLYSVWLMTVRDNEFYRFFLGSRVWSKACVCVCGDDIRPLEKFISRRRRSSGKFEPISLLTLLQPVNLEPCRARARWKERERLSESIIKAESQFGESEKCCVATRIQLSRI